MLEIKVGDVLPSSLVVYRTRADLIRSIDDPTRITAEAIMCYFCDKDKDGWACDGPKVYKCHSTGKVWMVIEEISADRFDSVLPADAAWTTDGTLAGGETPPGKVFMGHD